MAANQLDEAPREKRSQSVGRANLAALTSLRFAAAIYVVLFHVYPVFFPGSQGPLALVISKGYIGVSLFFVLSGFILTWNYSGRLKNTRQDVYNFLLSRIARIYPVYLACLIMAFPYSISPALKEDSLVPQILFEGILSAFMIQAWIFPAIKGWNAPGWSVSDEFLFYVMFPVVVITWSVNRFVFLLGVALVLMYVWPSLYWCFNPDGFSHLPTRFDYGPFLDTLRFSPACRVGEFIFGCAISLALISKQEVRSENKCFALLFLSIAGLMLLIFNDGIPYVYAHNGLYAISFGLLILALALINLRRPGFLGGAWLIFLGEISYALYLIHIPLLTYWRYFEKYLLFGGWSPVLKMCIFLVACFALSGLIYLFLEKPARSLIRKRFYWRDAG